MENEITYGSWAHAYLFVGRDEKAIDKLIDTITRAKKTLPEDIVTVLAEEASGKAGEIKIDSVREALHLINLTPKGDNKIAVIRNCHKLNLSSGNILLKTLEEPPKNVILILTAPSDSILSTIKSRCRIINLAEEENKQIEEKYVQILKTDFYQATKAISELVKNEEAKAFLETLENYFAGKMREDKDNSIKAIKNIWRVKSDMSSNVNQQLALENLYLNLIE